MAGLNKVSVTATLNLRATQSLALINEAVFEAVSEVIGFDTVATAKELCPILTKATMERYPGEMRDSIASKVSHVKAGTKAKITTDCGYGGYVEVGTVHMAAEPSIYPAFEQNVGRLPAVVQANLDALDPGEFLAKDVIGG